ncbi:MAG: hypothetical protein WBR18_06360 [Anaerolineales bacterium]
MTHAEDVLHHESDAGWVVLASQVPRLGGETPALAEHLVERMNVSRPAACLVSPSGETTGLDLFLEEIEVLLQLQPALLNASLEPPTELANASLIILAGGANEEWIERLDQTLLGDLLLQALAGGAILMTVGPAAGAIGTWALSDDGDALTDGLGWVVGAVVISDGSAPADHEPVRALLLERPRTYALGLGQHTLVALGPHGEIEVWGDYQPTLILGKGWDQG